SGFTWSDDQGVGVTLKHNDLVHSAQRHPTARPFKNKGFKHFHTIEQMMPKISKGTHVF
ncbi:hypothetical protein PAXRUDRAFT_179261, partial [Paxillus rubicundulus Ve08.2h10]